LTVIALALPAVKVDPEIVPSVIVRLPDPTSVADDEIVGLAIVCPCASVSTSSVEVPLPWTVPALTVATELLAIWGVEDRLPALIIDASELDSVDIMFISDEESEISVVSVEFCEFSESTWPAYCACDSSSANPVALMSPLTPSDVSSASVALPVAVVDVPLDDVVPDVELVPDVALVVPVDELVEETVVIPERTADRVAG